MGNVILTGFMGCGKSTVGVRLSYRLRKPIIDTDKEIEKREGRTIPELFRQEGEEYFRGQETVCLERMLETEQDKVISVGGGLPLRAENRELLHKLGTVIYLRASAETIYERLRNDTGRPLLQCDDPEQRIRELMAERSERYEDAADLIIDVDGKEFDQILDEIEEKLNHEEKYSGQKGKEQGYEAFGD